MKVYLFFKSVLTYCNNNDIIVKNNYSALLMLYPDFR